MQTTEVIDQVARSLGARVRLTGSASGDRQPAAAVSEPVAGARFVDVAVGVGSLTLRVIGRSAGDLDSRAWGVVDAAVHLLARAHGGDGGRRERVCAALLAGDATARTDALWELRSRRWVVAPDEPLRVWAVLVEQAGDVEQIALGRHLATALPAPTDFVDVIDDAVVLISPATVDMTFCVAAVERETRAYGARLRALATADCPPDRDDPLPTIRQALDAARLRAAMPERLAPRAEELGGWMLVQSVPTSPRLLQLVSPAAYALLTDGDEVQRQTVEAYLDEAGRAPDTCARLHIHRTTLYYRLEHMPPAVREALADGLQRSTLHLALKTARLWQARPELVSA
ncbi:PucR-like helix-turn-helix protein [Microbacterium sp. AG790]|uniref:helix-turn-helix domain-containing protein n=1 Tax=Microbacterium sp. AG790 TaxID=2183995 RepID=UPI000EB473B6|nr:helix-turn-helix domain-containing protein [Microbacterium sp. AG790]RKS93550.1 PucR-like helix-turn-helix protein [Microbacterium sp. AG790]